ncbi:class I lanthipeptide [Aquimarina algiphila]|uniref:class I lanthipeptide n=1 Tax=Aquimarina algiphila TaxID=2047982 RepID=UPI00232EF7B0|nr:class I lanthipeptide [Aquimarina algiphila]
MKMKNKILRIDKFRVAKLTDNQKKSIKGGTDTPGGGPIEEQCYFFSLVRA